MQKTEDGLGYISTSDESRETLGTQILRKQEEHLNAPVVQEVGETMTEMGKTICRELEAAINNARSKGIGGLIYMHIVNEEMPPHLGLPCHKITTFTRLTRPTPVWDSCLYSHNDGDSFPTFHWSLPPYKDHKAYLDGRLKCTPQEKQWIKQAMRGTLV